MKEEIRKRAFELGFDACGFTSADPPESGVYLEKWLQSDRHASMSYMQRTLSRRLDLRKTMPAARSVIVLSAGYHLECWNKMPATVSGIEKGDQSSRDTGHSAASTQRRRAYIAGYARFTDYHYALGERLRVLSDFIRKLAQADAESLCYVDTGPVMERDLAQRAGIGFIGKNTNLISPKLGNWTFLAEILTSLELEPDTPAKNRCGTCSRCLTACPTNAFADAFVLDARMCLSFHTIESKGAIPIEFRPLIGNRLFGCDDCLTVCPWNRFAEPGRIMAPEHRRVFDDPDIVMLINASEGELRRLLENTPLARLWRRRFLRNLCVVAGNSGLDDVAPGLMRYAADADEIVSEHAKWGLNRIGLRNSANNAL
ncbi:MAG: tRNA epoxyqueuosine(34) reductase QueG [Verrucomicrobia bacterium]|nr:tRNA epoxyqueuosine(34) reductase QueG [Verrucomicrobiota bacterium]MCF7709475.1 tRNA epoxyqueuosine(34) reductase QueG [Verrucomicrobiota bacterium]